ncbi:hypothetical protein BH23BAC1_BH23BAC1_14400 [soil metagenome]
MKPSQKPPLILIIFIITISTSFPSVGQKMSPGFDKVEYIELLKISSTQRDSLYNKNFPAHERITLNYRSPVIGLDNRWDLWISEDSVAVISIRGTTRSSISWLENVYGVMVPASGEITLADDFTFNYHLADNPRAAVHLGWLIGTAFLSEDISKKINACYNAGIKNFLIMGHSQGGSIAYLLTSHLRNLIKEDKLPADIQVKTYCSAAPKPGNLYYAYDYENYSFHGWAFNVVNSVDWVPETPATVQTIDDFNDSNPFSNAKSLIKKQRFPHRLAYNYVYKQLDKPSKKALKRYQKYLGNIASKYVKKHLKDYSEPEYYNSSHYTRAGDYIVLTADEEYFKKFPGNSENPFVNHMFEQYFYLAHKLPQEKKAETDSAQVKMF